MGIRESLPKILLPPSWTGAIRYELLYELSELINLNTSVLHLSTGFTLHDMETIHLRMGGHFRLQMSHLTL